MYIIKIEKAQGKTSKLGCASVHEGSRNDGIVWVGSASEKWTSRKQNTTEPQILSKFKEIASKVSGVLCKRWWSFVHKTLAQF